MHGAFRSHLMQQFAATARHQSRGPPMALAGWLREQQQHDEADETSSMAHRHNSSPTLLTHPDGFVVSGSAIGISDVSSQSGRGTVNLQRTLSSKSRTSMSRLTPDPLEDSSYANNTHEDDHFDGRSHLPSPSSIHIPPRNPASLLESQAHLRLPIGDDAVYAVAFDRAIAAAEHDIPNIDRRKISFRRCFRGDTLQQLCSTFRTPNTAPAACIATLVHQERCQQASSKCDHTDEDDSLPFVPPSSWNDLESYGMACAASHSVLLSLRSQGLLAHSESTSSQQTRRLLQAAPQQRIVALVVVTEKG